MAAPDQGATSRVPDLVFTAVALVAGVLALLQTPPTPVALAVLVAAVPWVLLALRRELPLPLFAVLTVGPVVLAGTGTWLGIGYFLTTSAASRVAARTDDRRLLGATGVAVVVLPFLPAVLGRDEWDNGALFFAFGNVFGMLAGAMLRRAERLAADLRLATARLADAAAREERHRIARDVHDLVAHSLTVVVLHVGGARRVLRADPAAAEGALADAERVCRESLDGIRGVVGLLREDDGGRPPVLTLDLTDLADSYRDAGLPVALTVRGQPASLPLVTRVTLHRVIQEALANAARHAAPGAGATVDVTIVEGRVEALVRNDRAAVPGPVGAGGYGLLGLGERVASLGGSLTGGPVDGTWVVRCSLPAGAARGDVVPVRAG